MSRVPKDMSRRQRVPPRRPDAGGAGGSQGPGPANVPPGGDGGDGSGGRRQPPWDQPAAPETASFGDWLRRQREMREISLRDIADRTKISLR
jgi:hypothetical protein